MSIRSWIRSAFIRPVSHPIRKAPSRARPTVETLEDRAVPATFTVTNVNNSGAGSLRDAITQAQSGANLGVADTIVFNDGTLPGANFYDATPDTIILGGAQLTLTDTSTTTIAGPGANLLSISGNNASRVFAIGAGKSAALSGLTITAGVSTDGSGLDNSGTVVLNQVIVRGNTATTGFFGGGGILNRNGATATLTNVTISGNNASGAFHDGGGMNNYGSATLTNCAVTDNLGGGGFGNLFTAKATLTNCTVSGNVGSGLSNEGGNSHGVGMELTLINCTVSGNTSNALGTIRGGVATLINSTISGNASGVGTSIDSKLRLGNTIVAGNNTGSAADVTFDSATGVISLGNNLIGKTATGAAAPAWLASDRRGTVVAPLDPLLGLLTDNGGPTRTMALLPGSPAINAGSNDLLPAGVTTDQRGTGFPRIDNGSVDVGAFESTGLTAAISPFVANLIQAIPGGLAGGSPLAADVMALSVALAAGDIPAAKTALEKLANDGATASLSGALGLDPDEALSASLALFEPIGILQGVVLAALGTPLSPVIVATGNSGLLGVQFSAIWQAIPGGMTGGSPLAADTMVASVALVKGDVVAAKAAFETLVNDGASASLSGALGSDPDDALAASLALFEPIGILQGVVLAALGTPLSPVIVATGNSGLLGAQFSAIWQAIPGGMTGGSPLAADTMAASVALVKGDVVAAKAAFETLVNDGASASLSGALGSDPDDALAASLALFEPIGILQGVVLAALGTPLSPVIVATGNSGSLGAQFSALWQAIPGGMTGGNPLAADVMQASIALATGDIAAAKAALDTLTGDIATASLSGALGSDPAAALSASLALFQPTGILEGVVLAALGTPLSPSLVDAGNSGLLGAQFITLWQNIPGGMTGGSPLAADTMQASVALAEGNIPGTVMALNHFFRTAVSAAATPGGELHLNTLRTLLTAAGTIESLAGAAPASSSISAPTFTYGTAGSVKVTVGSTGGTPFGDVTLTVDGASWMTQPLVGGAATFNLSGLNAGDYNLTAIFAAQGNNQGSSFGSGNLHVNKASSTTTVAIVGGPFTYTGLAQTPAIVTVTGAGGLNLTPVANYANNVNAGTAAASYAFAGDANHEASNASQTFTIRQATANITVTPYAVTYDGHAHTASGTATGVGGVNLAAGLNLSGTTHTSPGSYSDTWTFHHASGNYADATGTVTDSIASSGLSIRGDVYILNRTASGALTVSGNAALNVDGTLQVDSSSASAVILGGNARINASQTLIVGGNQVTGNARFNHAPTLHDTSANLADPLAALVAPTGGASNAAVNLSGNNILTLNPGVYPSITVSGNAKLILKPGIYVIGSGGITVSSNATITSTTAGGQGVLLYNSGVLTVSGKAAINLTASSTGIYAGVTIYQASNNASAVTISGDADLDLNGGVLYAANTQCVVTLSGKARVEAALVVNRLTLSGDADADADIL